MPMLRTDTATTQLQAYGQVGTLFSIVHRISESTSQVGWRLYRRTTDQRRRYEAQPTSTEVTSHAALDLWNQPNPWETRQSFVEATQQHLDLTGEGWWVVAFDPRFPTLPLEMWVVRPDRMTPVPHPTRYISGYIYTGPDGEQIPLQVGEVIGLKYPNPKDPYRGLGPVQAILADLDAARYSALWNRAFFLNSAEPGGVIQFPDKLSDDEFNEFSQRWREQHQGISGAHRVAILERGEWKSTSISQKDMQFAELRNVSREIIREAFGIHGHVLGLSEDVNKANAEAGATSFGKWLVRPRLQRIREALNTRLLPMFGAAGLEFDHDDPEPPDREGDNAERQSKTTAFSTLVGANVDPDDAAAVVGLPAMRMAEAGASDGGTRALAEAIQKIYLGVDTVVTWDEAREILNRAGAGLGSQPQPNSAPNPPAPVGP